jgi:hypothetical protein
LANILGHSLGACAEIDSQTAIMPWLPVFRAGIYFLRTLLIVQTLSDFIVLQSRSWNDCE